MLDGREPAAAEYTVNGHDRDGNTVGNMAIDAFVNACREEIDSKGVARVGNG